MATIAHRLNVCPDTTSTTDAGFTQDCGPEPAPLPLGWEIACSTCGYVKTGPRAGQYVARDDPAVSSHGVCQLCQEAAWERYRAQTPRNWLGELIPDWRGTVLWDDMMDALKADARGQDWKTRRRPGGRNGRRQQGAQG